MDSFNTRSLPRLGLRHCDLIKKLNACYGSLVYTTQVNSAFGARWLASSEVIIQVYSPPSIERRGKLQKSIIFQFIATDKVVFGAIFSTCVVYTKQLFISVSVKVGDIYLAAWRLGKYPPLFTPTSLNNC